MARILLADDDVEFCSTLADILTDFGHTVEKAQNGVELIGKLRSSKERPELIITDLVMPEKEGLGTIQDIRSAWPEIRIIAISGAADRSSMDYLKIALALGASHALKKPFSPHQILDAIADLTVGGH